jgi:16S rRNA G527 N7-methylase RsmG
MSRSDAEQIWRENVADGTETGWQQAGPLLDLYVDLVLQHARIRRLLSQAERNTEALWKHIHDCLQALKILDSVPSGSIMDVGSGNGLPGIPLALSMPDANFVLLDRSPSKADFLELVAARLGLRNVRVVCDEFGPAVLQTETPALLLSRAVKRTDLFTPRLAKTNLYPPSIAFATENNESDWIRLADRAQLELAKRVTYSLSDGSPGRVLLKFAPA